MSATVIGEKVKVCAMFYKGAVSPLWFFWKDKRITVKETTYTWKSVAGADTIVHFSVMGETACYELAYNQRSMEWRVEKVRVD